VRRASEPDNRYCGRGEALIAAPMLRRRIGHVTETAAAGGPLPHPPSRRIFKYHSRFHPGARSTAPTHDGPRAATTQAAEMIEAEYKARLAEPDAVRARLRERAQSEIVLYRDVYFDTADTTLGRADQEFRLRTITGLGRERHLLTFKDSAVHAETGSKPEFETIIGAREPMEEILTRLGYTPRIELTKHCENFRFSAGHDLLATIVTVPEIIGTFLELEAQTTEENLQPVLADLRKVLEILSNPVDSQVSGDLRSGGVGGAG
jgi:adenylate cyclase class 2